MKIESLYIYPIKSLRGVSVDSTALTKFGFPYDRRFMILQVIDAEDGTKTFKNMTVAHYNEMVRFFPSLDFSTGTMTVTFKPIADGDEKTITIPLEPDAQDLDVIEVEMHKSPTKAFRMPDKYNDWLSSCFGYGCILAYIGEHSREVRMSSDKYLQPNGDSSSNNSATAWLSTLTTKATGMLLGNTSINGSPSAIKFSDVAPYLIVSSKSLDSVHARLAPGETFDITKFRPNIVVAGADAAWEEDYWSELAVSRDDGGETKLECEHNCGRCRSINIDYATGAQGTGEAGKMLKKLASDRRVDPGTKWSPIFGRYAFLHPGSEGGEIRVGEEVRVSRRNGERTPFGTLDFLLGWECLLSEWLFLLLMKRLQIGRGCLLFREEDGISARRNLHCSSFDFASTRSRVSIDPKPPSSLMLGYTILICSATPLIICLVSCSLPDPPIHLKRRAQLCSSPSA